MHHSGKYIKRIEKSHDQTEKEEDEKCKGAYRAIFSRLACNASKQVKIAKRTVQIHERIKQEATENTIVGPKRRKIGLLIVEPPKRKCQITKKDAPRRAHTQLNSTTYRA